MVMQGINLNMDANSSYSLLELLQEFKRIINSTQYIYLSKTKWKLHISSSNLKIIKTSFLKILHQVELSSFRGLTCDGFTTHPQGPHYQAIILVPPIPYGQIV